MKPTHVRKKSLNLNSRKIWVCFCFIFCCTVGFSQSSQDWLHTQGNRIYNSDNTVFEGRGANIFDTRLNNAGAYSPPNVAEVNRRTDEIVDVWGADFLRLCLESNASLDEWQVHGLSLLVDTNYLNDIVKIVEHIGTKGKVHVLVSLWVDPSIDNMGWPTDQTIVTWRVLAKKLAKYPYVLFGICNEPQSNYDGSLDAQVWVRMNNVVAAIREEEGKVGSQQHIITVQGTGGWARFLQYYTTHPITAGGGTNIAYEVHVYDSQTDFQSRFIDPSKNIPVVIGEFGPAVGYMTLDECQTLMDTAEELQVPYLAWSFHQRAPPNLLVDQTGSGSGAGMDLVPTEWGTLLKNQLLSKGALRIRDLQATPSSFSVITTTEVLFSATVTVKDATISSVTIDLTQLGGSKVPMSNTSGNLYTLSYNVPSGLTAENKTVTVKAIDNLGNDRSTSIELQAFSPATEAKVIYNDNETLIKAKWDQNGTLSEASTGAFEGTKHYRFDYSLSYWWSGYGLNLNNWSGDGKGYDFTGYQSLKFACSLTGPASATITLIDANGSTTSSDVEITGLNNSYQEFTIPLASFTGMVLNDVGEIMININGNSSSGTGTFAIDNIRLGINVTATDVLQLQKTSQVSLSQNYPNPFSQNTSINWTTTEPGNVLLKVYDLMGREVTTLIDKYLAPGEHQVTFNAGKLPTGVYFVRLHFNNQCVSKKMIKF